MEASKINAKYTDIPSYKIVLGKATERQTDSGFVVLYAENNSMTNYVNQALENIEWGGIMVWLYQLENPNPDNDNLMKYFENV
jgi:hypothetical protein